eukprot:358619-Chlamydomonas_euryale.AAC.1
MSQTARRGRVHGMSQRDGLSAISLKGPGAKPSREWLGRGGGGAHLQARALPSAAGCPLRGLEATREGDPGLTRPLEGGEKAELIQNSTCTACNHKTNAAAASVTDLPPHQSVIRHAPTPTHPALHNTGCTCGSAASQRCHAPDAAASSLLTGNWQ